MKLSIAPNEKSKPRQNVVSALTASSEMPRILKQASEKDAQFVVDCEGKPSVIIMSVRDYIRSIAPPHPALAATRREAKKTGSSELSMAVIDREIAAHRRQTKGKKRIQPTK